MGRREEVLKFFEAQKEETASRVKNGIEQNRKTFFKVTVKDKDGNALSGVKVRAKLKKHDFKYGANLFMLDELETEAKNEEYRNAFAKAFNQATLPFYWSDLEPEEGKPRFFKDSPKVYRRPSPDLTVEYCEEKGIYPKAHCLTYFNFTPSWVDSQSVADQKKRLEKRYCEIAERYAGKIEAWEVINELMCIEAQRIRNPFFRADDVMEWNFKLAEKYFPNNELIINEASGVWTYGQFAWNRSPYYQMIERGIKNGARIDSIGMQYHIFTSGRATEMQLGKYLYNPKTVFEVLDCYSKLNRPIQITEITIPAYSNDKEDEAIQAEIIENLYSIWFSHSAVEMITYWNAVDGYAAWAPQGDMTKGENIFYGGLMRFDMSKKPAYEKIVSLFNEKWTTDEVKETDCCGTAKINGFYGAYDITVDGKVFTASVGKERVNEISIVLD